MADTDSFFRRIGKVTIFVLIGMIILVINASASGITNTPEWTSIVFNLMGLIFVGLITLMGVAAAQELKDRRDERQEDRTRVFEPVRNEMETILRNEHDIDEGGWVWSAMHAPEEFRQILARGLLQVPHRSRLRADIDDLHRLERALGERRLAFHKAGQAAIEEVLKVSRALPRSVDKWTSGEELAKFHRDDDQLYRALAARDGKDRWVERLKAQWREVEPDPAELFAKARAAVEASRESYRSAARAVLDRARAIRDGIDRATASGKRY